MNKLSVNNAAQLGYKQANNENDVRLIKNVKKSNCNKSFEELVERHRNLYYKICQKYFPIFERVGAPYADILNDIHFVFYKSLNSYNENKKTKFSTWLGNYARYSCLNHINNYKKYNFYKEEDFDMIAEREDRSQQPHATDNTEYIYIFLSKLKDKRILKVYRLRYGKEGEKNATWTEIAKKMKVSTQTAINLHSRGKKALGRKLKNKNNFDFV